MDRCTHLLWPTNATAISSWAGPKSCQPRDGVAPYVHIGVPWHARVGPRKCDTRMSDFHELRADCSDRSGGGPTHNSIKCGFRRRRRSDSPGDRREPGPSTRAVRRNRGPTHGGTLLWSCGCCHRTRDREIDHTKWTPFGRITVGELLQPVAERVYQSPPRYIDIRMRGCDEEKVWAAGFGDDAVVECDTAAVLSRPRYRN